MINIIQAKDRGTQLVLLPNGMTRREANNSYYNIKRREITWKVFVSFVTEPSFCADSLLRMDLNAVNAENKLYVSGNSLVGLFLDGVSEKCTLWDIMSRIFQPTAENTAVRYALKPIRALWEQHLRGSSAASRLPVDRPPDGNSSGISSGSSCSSSSECEGNVDGNSGGDINSSSDARRAHELQFLMHKVGSSSSAPLFIDLRPDATLGSSLKGMRLAALDRIVYHAEYFKCL